MSNSAYWGGAFTGEAYRRARLDSENESAWAKFQRDMEEEIRKRDLEIEVQEAVKMRVLKELERLDPTNPLLDVETRKQIRKEVESKQTS